MTVRAFVFICLTAALAGGGTWLLVVSYLDPGSAGGLGLALFFISLMLAIASLASLAGYAVRRLVTPSQFGPYAVRTALRQGVIISLFSAFLLFLQLWRLYRWWIAVIVVMLLISFELIFTGYDRSTRHHQPDRPAR